jgi:hypothetical protein
VKIKTSLLTAVVGLALSVAANAAPVTYFTEGSFDGGLTWSTTLSPAVATFGGTSLAFVNGSGTVNATSTPKNIGFGSFILASTTAEPDEDTLTGRFDLRIIETSPGGTAIGSNILLGTLSGQVQITGSTGVVTFSSNTVTYPNSQYKLVSADFTNPWGVALISPSTNSGPGAGMTTIQGTVVAGQNTPGSTVPEPSTYALLGSGLVGLGFMFRRRSAARQ